MAIYSLNNSFFLYNDIESIIKRIEKYYTLTDGANQPRIKSNTKLPPNVYMFSEEAQEEFNKLIPEIKSLHKDMYSLVEAIERAKENGKYDTTKLEQAYPEFRHFRLLNNKIKHSNNLEIEIACVTISEGGTLIGGKMHGEVVTIDVQFIYKDEKAYFPYSKFIEMFYKFLVEHGIITL